MERKMKFPNFLKIATIPKVRLWEVNKTLVKKEFQECAEKMLIEVFAEKLGFSYKLVYPEDKQYGAALSDGNWTGMVGMLQRKEADLIFHRIAITEDRMKVMDYSYPYLLDRIVFATRNFERVVSPETFLKPFTLYVWIAFALCFCITPIIYNIFFERKHSCERLIACGLFRDRTLVVKTNYSECIFRISWDIFMMFVKWCYTALVLSFLAFPTLSGVRNIQELTVAVTENKYQCMASPGSLITNVLLKFGGHSGIIGQNMRNEEETMNFEGVLQKTGLVKKIAVVASEIDFFHLREKYYVSEDEFIRVLIVIGISKDFCCKQHLDSVINNLWSSGIYQRLLIKGMLIEEHEIAKQLPRSEEHESSERSLSLEDFKGVFTLLACGYALAIVVLFLELVHSKYRHT